jgi:hypothetical protein
LKVVQGEFMSSRDILEANLARAGIPARVSSRSFREDVRGRIVQMDISRERGKEELRISVPEGDETEVKVLGIDPAIQQAVLMIHEPEREFAIRVWNQRKRAFEDQVRRTTEAKRRFLVGMDEQHLFIAQLTRPATSVKQAHEGLRPRGVPAGRRAKKIGIVRQGEWFFQPASAEELRAVTRHMKAVGVETNLRIGRGRGAMRGRPHVASESVLLVTREERTPVFHRGKTVGFQTSRETIEFVRGRVKHPDHHTIELEGWHKVFLNTEDRQSLSQVSNFVD